MLIETGYGKTFSMRIEDYLELTDEQLQSIIADNYGEQIEDPFVMSFSKQSSKNGKEDLDDIEQLYEELDIEDIIDDSLDYEEDL
jgi:hypothetical protein